MAIVQIKSSPSHESERNIVCAYRYSDQTNKVESFSHSISITSADFVIICVADDLNQTPPKFLQSTLGFGTWIASFHVHGWFFGDFLVL